MPISAVLAAPPPPPPPPPTPAALIAPSRSRGSAIALLTRAVGARSKPGGGVVVWRIAPLTRWARQPQRLLVLGSATAGSALWLHVRLPLRHKRSAWIRRDQATVTYTKWWVNVQTSSRRVTIYRRGSAVRRFRVVVGASASPTPLGLAAIYERVRQPSPRGFLGPWALHLTAVSAVLQNYGGGPGRVAIHGRGGASLADPLGTARSHGCVRADNADVRWLARHLPAGTPVHITGG